MADDGRRETVVVERSGGSGAGLLIGLAVLIVVAVAAYFLVIQSNSETTKNNAITGAAKSVESTADKAGSRVEPVYREGDKINVYDSRCPHQTTNIPHLALEGMKLTCPKHQWAFDIKTGKCVEKGNRPLKRFETKVENGHLYARW